MMVAGGLAASKFLDPPAVSNPYLNCFAKYDMESTTALMFVVIGASIALFGMALLNVIQTFQHINPNKI